MKQKILIIALLFFSMVVAQDQEQSRRRSREDRVRFGGKANVGIDFRAIGGLGDREINDSRLNRIATVETELVVFPADNVRLEFDLEYDWRFTDVNLQKLFIRYDFDNSNARLGFMKKMFSWEEIKSGTDRLFIKKSMLNNILSDFFLLDRDFTIQYRYNFPSYTLIGGFSGDGSNRIFGNLTLLTRQLERKRFMVAAMYNNYEDKDGSHNRQSAFYGNVGMEFSGDVNNFEVEAIWGRNPERYGYLVHSLTPDAFLEFNENENIGFWGLRFQQSFPISIDRNHLRKITPVYEFAFFNDEFAVKNAYWQARQGVNLSFDRRDRVQWRTNLDLIMTANNQESSRPQIIRQRVISEIFVHW
ncbi:MAG: hypothetical protein FWE23_09645 [Chitinivibrionia bacterium]|nr:hypothetical protein [Chitinivibrionia bacterium]